MTRIRRQPLRQLILLRRREPTVPLQHPLGGGALVNLGINAGKRFGASQRFGAMVGGTENSALLSFETMKSTV